MSRLWAIGVGPGDPDLLTLKALKLLKSADVVLHDDLIREEILALVPAIHVNHLYNVSIAERQAWQFARVEQSQAVMTSTVGLSLTPRRLRNYTNWPLEWVLGLATAGAVLALIHAYRTSPQEHSLRLVFWVPGFYLYFQLGSRQIEGIIRPGESFRHNSQDRNRQNKNAYRMSFTRKYADAATQIAPS